MEYLRTNCFIYLLPAVWIILTTSLVNTHEMRIVCYVGTWAAYRQGLGYFDAQHIDVSLCTHIMYSFATIDNATGTLTSIDEYRDFTMGGYESFTKLKEKNPDVKIIIAVGGWNEGPARFSKIASTIESQQVFAKSAVEFIRKHNFDGLDIGWVYPGFVERGGKLEDRENLNKLVQELRSAMPVSWPLSMSIGGEVDILSKGYDFQTLSKYIDFFSAECYDYHGNWEKSTGFNSPLYSRADESVIEKTLNVNFTVHALMRMGVPRHKIVVGMPLFGRVFILEDPTLTAPASPTIVGESNRGPHTDDIGFLGYSELCNFTEDNGWTHHRDQYQMVPYMYKNYTWISYDDPKSLYAKAKFVLENNLGGVSVWSLETDDFLATCNNNTKFPLMDAILKGLGKRNVTSDLELITLEASSSVIKNHCSTQILFFILLLTIFLYL